MRRYAMAACALALAAPAESASISEMTDDLQRIQLQVAQGDRAAYAAQISQLKAIGFAIASAKPDTWKDRREADSLAIYILSGGALADVAPLLRSDTIAASERPLAEGALAYLTNHEADAIALLRKEDLTALNLRLSGEVAFARSVLETKRNPGASIAFLDWARLLAPGGLVEEAALRREILLLAEGKDVTRMAMLIRQYSTRFPASLYAPDFFRDVAASIARFGVAENADDYASLSRAVVALSHAARTDFLLLLARCAVVDARFSTAAAAAGDALAGAPAGSVEATRASLYLAASRMFSGSYDSAVADISTIAAAKLDPTDAGLLAAIRRAGAGLHDAPEPGVQVSSGVKLDDGQKDKASGPALTIERARDALDRTASIARGQDGAAR